MELSEGKSSIGYRPGKTWEFDESVAECFDDMLERSVPNFWEMRSMVAALSQRFIQEGGTLLDLGAGLAGVYESIINDCGEWPSGAKYFGLESSQPMIDLANKRVAVEDGCVAHWDLSLDGIPNDVRANVVTCVLTLHYLPMHKRPDLLKEINRALNIGGALILVEKVLPSSSSVAEVMEEEYVALNLANGYSLEDIEAKRAALENVLVPASAVWTESMLTVAGFSGIECFWRWNNFAGWIALKG